MDIYYHNISFAFERVKDDNKFYLDELSILVDFLLSSDTSILTKYLKEKYDLLDISYDFESEIEYPVLSIILKSYNPFSEDICVYEDIKHFLKEEIRNGLDRDSIEGLISIENFKTIEEDFGYKAKGLSYFLDMISYYQYNTDREYLHLSKNINFDYLIKQAENGYFEKLLNESIILSKNVLECSIKAGEVLEEQLEANADFFVDDTENENRPSDYIIPISLDDISFSKHIEFEKHYVDDIEISFVKNENEDITFLTLMFLYEDDLKDVGLFVELFSEVDTKNFTRKEIKTISDKYIGDLEVSFESITLKNGDIENYIVFEIKFLSKNIDNALDILLEIINNSVFDDTKYILSKIDEIILEYDEELVTDNVRRALLLAYKNINKKYFYKDIVSGEIFYNNLLKYKEEKLNFNNLASILQKSKTIKTYISGNEFSDLGDKISRFLKRIEIGKSSSSFNYNNDYFETNSLKELFLEANTNTYTNVCVSKIENYPYSGDKEVFASIIKNEYLSTEIRLNGGAYGYGMFMDYDMYFHMFSVDDPHYKRTLSIFKNTHEFIKKYAQSEEIIMKNIIGTINEIENYRSFYEKYYSYVMYNIKGVDNDYLDKIKKEILSANYIKILDFSMKFNQSVEEGIFLTIGKNVVK